MLKNHFRRIVFGIILGIIGGLVYYKFTPKVYEAEGVVYLNDVQETRGQDVSQEVSQLIGFGGTQSVPTEVEFLRDEQFFKLVLARVNTNLVTDASEETALFNMYTVLGAPGSKAVSIDVKAHSPETAALIANTIAGEYSDLKAGQTGQTYDQARKFLASSVASAQNQLDLNEAKLLAFRNTNETVDVGKKIEEAASYQAKLEETLQGAQDEKKILTREMAAQKAEVAKLPELYTPSFTQYKNQAYLDADSEINKLEVARTQALTLYNEKSTRITQIDSEIKRLQALKVKNEKDLWLQNTRSFAKDPVRTEFQNNLIKGMVTMQEIDERIRTTQAALAAEKAKTKDLPTKAQEATVLGREEQLWTSRLQRLKEQQEDLELKANAASAAAVTPIPIVADPLPASPILLRCVPIGAVIGAFVLLIISMTIESLRTTVRTSTELSEVLGLPVSATTPQLKSRDVQARLRELPSSNFKPFESFRFMASRYALTTGTPKCLLFTSAGGGVGCSSAAGEFALAASRMGIRTVLVDADLRYATLSTNFDVEDKSGVREIINRSMLPSPDNQIAMPTAHPNLSIVPAGSKAGDGIADVPLSSLASLIATIKEGKDLIVIDSPPCNVLSDAARFVPLVDEVCLVVSARRTKNAATLEAETLLRSAGAENVSLILTGTNPSEEAFSRAVKYSA